MSIYCEADKNRCGNPASVSLSVAARQPEALCDYHASGVILALGQVYPVSTFPLIHITPQQASA